MSREKLGGWRGKIEIFPGLVCRVNLQHSNHLASQTQPAANLDKDERDLTGLGLARLSQIRVVR